MVSERWLATYIPLLVLSCVPAADTPRIPCCDIVTKLNLAALNRPWQVGMSAFLNLDHQIYCCNYPKIQINTIVYNLFLHI